MSTSMPKPTPVEVTVAPGKTIYTRGHSAPFRAGESFQVDAATAAELIKLGNAVAAPGPAPAAPTAAEPHAAG